MSHLLLLGIAIARRRNQPAAIGDHLARQRQRDGDVEAEAALLVLPFTRGDARRQEARQRDPEYTPAAQPHLEPFRPGRQVEGEAHRAEPLLDQPSACRAERAREAMTAKVAG